MCSKLRDRGHKPSSCRDNLGGVHTIIVHDDLAEAAHIQDVVVIQRAAVQLGVNGEAIAADVLAVQLVAFFCTATGSPNLEATAAALEGANAAQLLCVVLILRLALPKEVGRPWCRTLLAWLAGCALA